MTTKIKGHRIDDKSIDRKHLSDAFQLKEGDFQIKLNHPTHSNAYDLTATQHAVLTQGGNAEGYHYHAGGEGGEAGIYTHKQIDKAILELNMRLNAYSLRLENCLTDYLDDYSDIDFGIQAPILTGIQELHQEGVVTDIHPDRRYEYRAAIFKGLEITHPSNIFGIDTSAEVLDNGKVIEMNFEFDPAATGIKIWRSKMLSFNKEIILTQSSILAPDTKINFEMQQSDESINKGLIINIPYSTKYGVDEIVDLASVLGGGSLAGAKLGTAYKDEDILNFPTDRLIYGFYNMAENNFADELFLMFDNNPAYIPEEFMIQYTNDKDPDVYNDAKWLDFTGVRFSEYDYSIRLGTVSSQGYVTENQSPILRLEFPPTEITGIRVIITKTLGSCLLQSIRSYISSNYNNLGVENKLTTPIDVSDSSMLVINVQGSEDHNVYGVKLKETSNNEGLIPYSRYNYDVGHNTLGVSANRHYRSLFRPGGWDGKEYSKFRIGFYGSTSWDTEITDVTFGCTNNSNSATIAHPETFRTVTFHGGSPVGKMPDGESVLWSDWIDIAMPDELVYGHMVTFKIIKGNIYGYSNGNGYTFYKDNEPNAPYDISGSGWSNYQASYFYNQKLQFAKDGVIIPFDSIPEKNREGMFTHYLDLSSKVDDFDKLDLVKYMLYGTKINGRLKIGDMYFSKSQRLNLSNAAIITPESNGETAAGALTNLKSISTSNYWLSSEVPTRLAPVIVSFRFSEIQSIDRIRMALTYDNADYALEEYKIQYTQDLSATKDDPMDSDKWIDITNMTFAGRDGRVDQDDIGLVTGSHVTQSKLYNELIDLKFSQTNAAGFRIIIFNTVGRVPVRMNYFDFITAGMDEEYEVIHQYDFDDPDATTYTFVDEGAIGTIEDISLVNTTASKNIFYDVYRERVSVLDKTQPGVLVTKTIPSELFSRIFLVIQGNDESIYFEASNNGGRTWFPVIKDQISELGSPGSEFKLRATLSGDDTISAYSLLHAL